MAQEEIPSCGGKGKQAIIPEENGGGQTQGHTGTAESWLTEVKRRRDSQQYNIRQVSSKVCIYKVPKPFKDDKPEAYLPTVVSLGPYHHKTDPKFSAMDEHKFEAVHRTLKRLNGVTLDDLVAEIKNLENDIRNCYEDSAVEWNGEILSGMFVMDACFILEYFRSYVEGQTMEGQANDITSFSLIFNNKENWMHMSIIYDIIKLENQIPLFLLTTLLQLEFGNDKDALSKLAEILSPSHLFKGHPFETSFDENENTDRLEKHIKNGAYHLLDLSRRMVKELLLESGSNTETAAAESNGCFGSDQMCICCRRAQMMNVPTWLPRPPWKDIAHHIFPCASPAHSNNDRSFNPRAELLHNAGIKFKSGAARFEKRRFGRNTLSLPQMNVDDSTERVLRNLMAFEEFQRRKPSPKKTVISHYIGIMEDLIDSERDVSIFKKAKIIRSFMGSDAEVADMFNHLCKGITIGENNRFEFELVAEKASQHYNSQWKVWVNEFREQHCSKPWYVISLVAAILILLLTAVQTFSSLKIN